MNCWEHMSCGREEGGAKVDSSGVCPAYTEQRLDEVHGGQNAGRACWVVAGTLCGETVQGSYAQKQDTCLGCDFYKTVRNEEIYKGSFMMTPLLVQMLIQ